MLTSFGLLRLLTMPAVIVPLIWLVSLVGYGIASGLGSDFAYFNTLVSIEGIIDDSSLASYVWLLMAGGAFGLGIYLAHQLPPTRIEAWNWPDGGSQVRAARTLIWVFMFTLSVATIWVGGAVVQFGGIGNLAALAASDNTQARDVVVSASFPGGRLISSGFIGIAVYAAALLCDRQRPLPAGLRRRVALILMASLTYLGVIPVLVSGRVNFFVAVIAAFVAGSHGARRTLPIQYIAPGIVLLGLVWTAKQYFTLSHIAQESSALEQGYEGLIFYVYNDVLNALNTLADTSGTHTLGWYSLRFVFFFTFTDKTFLKAMAEEKHHISQYVTAGEVPMLAAPIVDFGAMGLIVLMMFGFWAQHWHSRATLDAGSSAIHGVTFACLLLSVHATFLTSQEVAYSILLIGLMSRHSSRRIHTSATLPTLRPHR